MTARGSATGLTASVSGPASTAGGRADSDGGDDDDDDGATAAAADAAGGHDSSSDDGLGRRRGRRRGKRSKHSKPRQSRKRAAASLASSATASRAAAAGEHPPATQATSAELSRPRSGAAADAEAAADDASKLYPCPSQREVRAWLSGLRSGFDPASARHPGAGQAEFPSSAVALPGLDDDLLDVLVAELGPICKEVYRAERRRALSSARAELAAAGTLGGSPVSPAVALLRRAEASWAELCSSASARARLATSVSALVDRAESLRAALQAVLNGFAALPAGLGGLSTEAATDSATLGAVSAAWAASACGPDGAMGSRAAGWVARRGAVAVRRLSLALASRAAVAAAALAGMGPPSLEADGAGSGDWEGFGSAHLLRVAGAAASLHAVVDPAAGTDRASAGRQPLESRLLRAVGASAIDLPADVVALLAGAARARASASPAGAASLDRVLVASSRLAELTKSGGLLDQAAELAAKSSAEPAAAAVRVFDLLAWLCQTGKACSAALVVASGAAARAAAEEEAAASKAAEAAAVAAAAEAGACAAASDAGTGADSTVGCPESGAGGRLRLLAVFAGRAAGFPGVRAAQLVGEPALQRADGTVSALLDAALAAAGAVAPRPAGTMAVGDAAADDWAGEWAAMLLAATAGGAAEGGEARPAVQALCKAARSLRDPAGDPSGADARLGPAAAGAGARGSGLPGGRDGAVAVPADSAEADAAAAAAGSAGDDSDASGDDSPRASARASAGFAMLGESSDEDDSGSD